MRPLEVFALDRDFNRLTGSIPYTSLQWCRRYYEPGTFEIHVLSSVYSPDWAYIYTEDRPETGIIQKREYTDDQEVAGGEDTIRLLGYFTERWLYDYTFLVEDKAIEADYIFKPTPKPTFANMLPELYQDGLGNTYVMRGEKLWTADGTPTNYTTNGMTRLEYDMAPGVTASVDNSGRPLWYQDTGFNYFDKDGDLYRVSAIGSAEPHKVDASAVVPITVTGNSFGASDGVVYNEGGSWYWFGSYSRREEDTWIRQVDRWEESTAGLQTNPGGNVAVRYRVVKGPWNLRTNVDEVGVPRDNLQAIISWAQRMWGNSILYDEPGFEGVTKVMDANLKNFGEFSFSELATVGASVRMFYSFVSNVVVFQIWKGRDLTQSANQGKAVSRSRTGSSRSLAAPSLVSARDSSYPVPDGYTALEYVESSGSCYVDTGFAPTHQTRVVADFQLLTSYSSIRGVFGVRDTPSGEAESMFVFWNNGASSFRSDYFGTQVTIDGLQPTSRYTVDKDGNQTSVGGKSAANSAVSSGSCVNSLYLFGVNSAGEADYLSPARLWSMQVYDGGEPSLRLVPALRDSDQTVGLYDQVGGTFYAPSGGALVAGAPIDRPKKPLPDPDPGELPSSYVRLQYVDSDGTQWVDTGITTNQDSRVVMEAAVTTDPSGTGYVGAYFFGSANAWKGAGQEFYVYGGDVTMCYGPDFITKSEPPAPTPGQVVRVDMDGREATVSVDGSEAYSFEATPRLFASPQTLKLLALMRTGETRLGALRVYSAQIYNGSDTMLANLWPVRRVDDDKVGFYDAVRGIFLASSGSGDLVAGPDLDVPDPGPTPSDLSPWVVFSDTWGSMHGYTYSYDDSNYKNKCYVLYEYDEPMNWDSETGQPVHTTDVVLGSDNELDTIENYGSEVADHIPYKTKRGYVTVRLDDDYRDIECYLDLRDSKPEFDEDWPRGAISDGSSDDGSEGTEAFDWSTLNGLRSKYSAWGKTYEAAGKSELNSKYSIERSLDTGTLSQDEYLTTWDLGDIVDMAIYSMGVTQESRIVGIDEVHEVGHSTVTVQLGETELTQTKEDE